MASLDAAYNALQNSGGDKMMQALLAKKSAEQQPFIDKLKDTANSPLPTPPEQEKQPDAPKMGDFGKDAQDYTTAMSVLSALTGAFSRQHATTALNAFGAGIKGYQEGNKQAFDEAHKQWKDASEAAIANNKTLTDKYKEILDNRKLTEEEQMNGINAIAEQYHDNIMAVSTSISQAVSIYDSQVKAAATAEAAHERLALMKQTLDQKFNTKLPQDVIDQKVEMLHSGLSYTQAGLTGTRNGTNPERTAVDEAWQKKYPDDDYSKAIMQRATTTAEGKKYATQEESLVSASNILDKSLPSLLDISKKYSLSDSTDINSVYNFMKSHASSEDFANFSTQLRAVTSDYSQLIGRGKQTVHSDDEALRILNESQGTSSLQGFQQAVKSEEGNLKAGLQQTAKDLNLPTQLSGASGSRVKVSDPDGKPHTIDQSELQDALNHGWKQR